MKKHFIIAAIAIIFAGYAANAQTSAGNVGLKGAIGLHLNGGLALPVSGDYDADTKATDVFNAGPTFGLGCEYYLTDAIGVGLEGNFLWNPNKDDYKTEGKDPVRSIFNVGVYGKYDFRSMMPKSPIAPWAKAGVGMYMWNHLDDGIGGDVLKTNKDEEFKGTSFGFNVGIGANYLVTKNFEIGLGVDYNMFFPKDEDKFDKDFAAQSYISPSIRFAYYFK